MKTTLHSKRSSLSLWALGALLAAACGTAPEDSRLEAGPSSAAAGPVAGDSQAAETAGVARVERSEEEWRELLSPEEFRILRQAGTERAFTGKYAKEKAAGTYRCAGCNLALFDSATKFESGTGWPSFWEPAADDHVATHTDTTLGMKRTEVVCAACGGHLGHVFPDGPEPTGLRYCINSAALSLDRADQP